MNRLPWTDLAEKKTDGIKVKHFTIGTIGLHSQWRPHGGPMGPWTQVGLGGTPLLVISASVDVLVGVWDPQWPEYSIAAIVRSHQIWYDLTFFLVRWYDEAQIWYTLRFCTQSFRYLISSDILKHRCYIADNPLNYC